MNLCQTNSPDSMEFKTDAEFLEFMSKPENIPFDMPLLPSQMEKIHALSMRHAEEMRKLRDSFYYTEWKQYGYLRDREPERKLQPEVSSAEENKRFSEMVMRDIPYFHKLYVKYQDPKWLEIAQNLGTALKRLSTPRV
jgi:hypothetical protein